MPYREKQMILRIIIFHRQYVVCLSCGKSEICSILFKHKSSLCNDASLPRNKKALKHSRHQTNCSELEISWKLICNIYCFGHLWMFRDHKGYLKCWAIFLFQLSMCTTAIRLSVYFHLRKINTRKAITASFVGKMIFHHVKHKFC